MHELVGRCAAKEGLIPGWYTVYMGIIFFTNPFETGAGRLRRVRVSKRVFFLFRRVIISKIFIPKGRYSEIRSNDPSG